MIILNELGPDSEKMASHVFSYLWMLALNFGKPLRDQKINKGPWEWDSFKEDIIQWYVEVRRK